MNTIDIDKNLLQHLLEKMMEYFHFHRENWNKTKAKIYTSTTTIYKVVSILKKLKKIDYGKTRYTLENACYLFAYETGSNPSKIVEETYKILDIPIYY
jgi:hypothetical protein